MSKNDVKAIIEHMDEQHLETVTKFSEVNERIDTVEAKVDTVDAKVESLASNHWSKDESPC